MAMVTLETFVDFKQKRSEKISVLGVNLIYLLVFKRYELLQYDIMKLYMCFRLHIACLLLVMATTSIILYI